MIHKSGRGKSIARFSKRPFLNARRFKYIDKNGIEGYVYCDRFPERMSTFKFLMKMIVFLLMIIIFCFVITINLSYFNYIFIPPKPLKPVYEITDVHINDGIDVIEDKNGLEDILQQFEDTTGISPYVVTVYDSEWQGKYDELLEYAHYIYLNKFLDEQHFLIVYSEPENAEELEYVYWSWEMIRGDETGLILTEVNLNRFEEYLNKNFMIKKISVGEAFEKTFEDSLTYMMEYNYMKDAAMLIIFFLLWFSGFLYLMISTIIEYKMGKMDFLEVPMEDPVTNTVPAAMGSGNENTVVNNSFYDDDSKFV